MPQLWWERNDIGYRENRLFSGNQDLHVLAESSGTPAYAYNAARIQQNLTRLSDAFRKQRIQFKIFYALKANRYLPLVTSLKLSGRCRADVCSPGELLLARQAGFHENEITYTGTSVSNEDIECRNLSILMHGQRSSPSMQTAGDSKFTWNRAITWSRMQ
jgi:diaminopimelate decarboxylase